MPSRCTVAELQCCDYSKGSRYQLWCQTVAVKPEVMLKPLNIICLILNSFQLNINFILSFVLKKHSVSDHSVNNV